MSFSKLLCKIKKLTSRVDDLEGSLTDVSGFDLSWNPATGELTGGVSEGGVTLSDTINLSLDITREDRLLGVAGASFTQTGSDTNSAGVTITLGESLNIASITPSGTGNDTRRYQITFSNPVTLPYIVVDSKSSDEPNGDERKQQWKAGSKTATGFIMEFSVDDNGGAEDSNIFHEGDFVVMKRESVITDVELA